MEKVKIKNYPMINPTPIVLVGAVVDGKPNYATIGAFGVVCKAPVFYISLKNDHHTTTGVRESGYFSVNIPSTAMIQKTDYCGLVSGKDVDKSILFPSFYDRSGTAPMISECPMSYLCRVIQTVTIHDFEVFFGEIVSTYAKEDCLTDGVPDPAKVDPTLLMGFHYYSLGHEIGKVYQEGKKPF